MFARIQYSVCSGIIFFSTFIPEGAWNLNPKIIGDVALDGDEDENSINDGNEMEIYGASNDEEKSRNTTHDYARSNDAGEIVDPP